MRGATSAGFKADIQFNPAPVGHEDRVVRRFRIDGMGNTRSVTGVANPPDGHFIEKWGQETGYTWGYVNQPNMCNASNTYCHLFRVNMNGDQGDSGGPCVNAQAAHGLVQGGVPGSYTYCTQISMSPATVMQW